MKNLRSALAAAGLAFTICAGCGKKEDAVKVIEDAENALPPAEQMPVEDRVVKPLPRADHVPTDAEVAAGAPAVPSADAASHWQFS